MSGSAGNAASPAALTLAANYRTTRWRGLAMLGAAMILMAWTTLDGGMALAERACPAVATGPVGAP